MTSSATRPAGAAPPGAPAAQPRGRAMMPLMSACAILVISMVAAINLAIPKLAAGDLRPSATEVLWTVDAYVLVFGCLLIPAGAVGDRFGRKGALLAGLALFAAGCLLSAAAPTVPVLLAGRLVTGAGAALIMPATLSLLLQVTEPARKPQAIAAWTAATGIAGAIGNLAGGAVLQWLPWQGLFLLGAPAAAVLAALVARLAPRGERHPANLDLPGSALLTLALFALLFGIIEGPEKGWSAVPVLGAFGVAALLMITFTRYALRAAHPLLDPRLFAGARLRSGVLGVAVAFFGLFALFFVNAQYLQYLKGYSPLLTGVAIGPLVLGMIVVSKRSVALARRLGERTVVGLGLLVLAAGLGLLSLADAATPYPLYALFLVVMSVGMGLCVPTLSIAVMTALPPARAGLGSGLNGAARELGSALGVAAIGTVLAAHVPGSHGGAGGPGGATAFGEGMAAGFRIVSAVVLVLGLLALAGLGGRREERG
ncbi:MFS transporter [Actinomadura hibisca]|uniref:MFS transporter n=1 Tax=Actinomadura hibisca TaxID=68565 RepID=UPI000831201F|nr:MFS transporter [Actinomadura hibisca]